MEPWTSVRRQLQCFLMRHHPLSYDLLTSMDVLKTGIVSALTNSYFEFSERKIWMIQEVFQDIPSSFDVVTSMGRITGRPAEWVGNERFIFLYAYDKGNDHHLRPRRKDYPTHGWYFLGPSSHRATTSGGQSSGFGRHWGLVRTSADEYAAPSPGCKAGERRLHRGEISMDVQEHS